MLYVANIYYILIITCYDNSIFEKYQIKAKREGMHALRGWGGGSGK